MLVTIEQRHCFRIDNTSCHLQVFIYKHLQETIHALFRTSAQSFVRNCYFICFHSYHYNIGTKIEISSERKNILATLVCKMLSCNKFILFKDKK